MSLSYNLGRQQRDSLFLIKNKRRVDDGLWHRVSVSRMRRSAVLVVDDESVKGSSEGEASELNTDGIIYIGGYHHSALPVGLPPPFNAKFNGCMRELTVDSEDIPVSSLSSFSSQVTYCQE